VSARIEDCLDDFACRPNEFRYLFAQGAYFRNIAQPMADGARSLSRYFLETSVLSKYTSPVSETIFAE